MINARERPGVVDACTNRMCKTPGTMAPDTSSGQTAPGAGELEQISMPPNSSAARHASVTAVIARLSKHSRASLKTSHRPR
jgi:hypothetical protein